MSTGPNLEDYLKQGMYGPKLTKPEERRKFLGTLRERVIIALTQDQVYATKLYPQVEAEMKQYPNAHLLLNGAIAYRFLSKYIKIAEKYQIPFKIVHSKSETEIGLVLTANDAIEKKQIFITEEETQNKAQTKTKSPKHKPGLLKKLFRKK